MLNKKGVRELAYVVNIDEIRPIEGADRVELAIIGGWQVMVRKGQFKPGDPAVYFEIDSKVPETSVFEFLAPKHYKVKTQKYFKGKVLSQGLLMSAADFGWHINSDNNIVNNEGIVFHANDESRFLTEELGVKYAVEEDNIRKANSIDKYKTMAARHPELFKKAPIRWLMRRSWGKKLLFIFFGNKKKSRNWPAWVVKTDEERCQNLTGLLFGDGIWHNEVWIATEKIDGTSTTFTIKRGRGKKYEFYVCSRNVVFDKPDKKCFYDSNVYLEMASKYDIENILVDMLKHYPEADWITIQGETFGNKIQNRDYSIGGHDFLAFNLIMSNTGRWNTLDMRRELEKYDIQTVPIVQEEYTLPDSIEALLEYADGKSKLDGEPREGIVFRSLDGEKSFKAVSNSYLLKFHS